MNISWKKSREKFWVLTDQVTVSCGAFVTYLLLAKALGLYTFGYFSAIGMVQVFLLSLTLSVGAQVFQVVYPSLPDQSKIKLANGFFWQQCLIAIIVFAMGCAVSCYWKTENPGSVTILFASAAIALYLFQDFLRKLLLTQSKARSATLIDAMANGLQLVLLYFAWHFKMLTHQMAWAIIAITFLPSIIMAILIIRPGAPSVNNLRFAWQYQKKKCGWLLSSSLLQWGSGYFFVVSAAWWLGAAALGALRLAQYIFGLLNVLLQAVENYALPKVAAGNMSGQFISLLAKKLLLLMLPVIALLSIFSSQILFFAGGEDYTTYSFVMKGLSLVYLVMTIGYPVRIAIRSRHLDKSYFIAYCISVTAGVCLAPVLIKNFQLYGVIAGMLLTQVISISYWMLVLQRKKYFSWRSFISF